MGFERKILNAGFSFVVLIFISAYVANLAAYLTNQKLEEYVKTVAEAVKHNRTICAPDVVQSKLEGKYPDAKRAGLFVFLADYDEAFQKFNDDTCQLIAMDENFFSQHSARFHKDHELNVRNQNLKVTLQPILSVPMAFPARRNIATALSYCMVIALERNIDIKNYIQKYRVKSNVMAEQVDYNIYISILDGSHITSLDVQHMIGPFVCLLLSIICAFMVFTYEEKETVLEKLPVQMSMIVSSRMKSLRKKKEVEQASDVTTERRDNFRESVLNRIKDETKVSNDILIPIIVKKSKNGFLSGEFKGSNYDITVNYKADEMMGISALTLTDHM